MNAPAAPDGIPPKVPAAGARAEARPEAAIPEWQRNLSLVALSVGSLAATVAAYLHATNPEVKIDDTTFKLLLLAIVPWMIPWLASSIQTLKAPGGWEIAFKKAEEAQQVAAQAKGEVEAAQQAAVSAQTQAQEALQGVDSVSRRADVTSTQPVPLPVAGAVAAKGSAAPEAPLAQLEKLAKEYVDLRASTPSGWARTGKFNDLVKRMMALASQVDADQVQRLLTEESWGKRLSAYALLYANPQGSLLGPLVQAVVSEPDDHSFGQYWGILATGRVLALGGDSNEGAVHEAEAVFGKLRRYLDRLKPKSDRHYELSRILRQYGKP